MTARQRLAKSLFTQFHGPRGFVGILVGWEMTLRPSNRQRNRWAVGLLDVHPGERVLEIGFGPGLAIRELARRVGDGLVYGIDHSEVMVRQATFRNRSPIRAGRVELRRLSVRDLGKLPRGFDRVLAVNNYGMWPDKETRLKELIEVVRPGGRVAIVSQPRCPGATAATTAESGRETADQLARAGFTNIRVETLDLRPPVACVLADVP